MVRVSCLIVAAAMLGLGSQAAIAWEGDYMDLLAQVTQPPETAYRNIPLTQGKCAIVDASDYEALACFKWFAYKAVKGQSFYARRNARKDGGGQYVIHMHREILRVSPGVEVDHWDGDGLNNRRSNLRPATGADNQHNRKAYATNKSGFKGVCFKKSVKKWVAQISLGGKRHHLGYFHDPEAAHAAYVAAARDMHGEFAHG